MAIVKCKPTSPGRRHVVKVVNSDLYKGKPYAPLLEKNSKSGGRNNTGRITVRHVGGGHKHHYRVIDFKRTKDGIPAKVERLEYDPNRSANIALVLYADGERTTKENYETMLEDKIIDCDIPEELKTSTADSYSIFEFQGEINKDAV